MFTTITETYKRVFAFLSHAYWNTQDEYDDGMIQFYDNIKNADAVFTCVPTGNLTLYEDEWFNPKTVDDTVDELDEDDDIDTTYVCNWKDDDGNTFYTMLFKDSVDEDVRCITRTLPMEGLGCVPEKLVDDGWKPLLLKLSDGSRMYVWESQMLTAYNFIELYKSWVTQYPFEESDDDEDDEEENNGDEDDESNDDDESCNTQAP